MRIGINKGKNLNFGKILRLLVSRTPSTILLFLLGLHLQIVGFAQNASAPSEKDYAERIWEQAIEAKGGRESINKIDNILETSVIKGEVTLGKKYDGRDVYLEVLPDKFWNYDDQGASVFGTNLTMFNYENITYYFARSVDSNIAAKPITEKVKSKGYQNGMISLLLEAKGLKPVILRARTEKVKLFKPDKTKTIEVDIVETKIDGRRVDFAFDRQTHLPIQVGFYHEDEPNREPFKMEYHNYIDYQGLKVPQLRVSEDGTLQTFKLQFNVEYDPEIFEKSPAKPSSDSWKKKP